MLNKETYEQRINQCMATFLSGETEIAKAEITKMGEELKEDVDSIISGLKARTEPKEELSQEFIFKAMLLRCINYLSYHFAYKPNDKEKDDPASNYAAIVRHFEEALMTCRRK